MCSQTVPDISTSHKTVCIMIKYTSHDLLSVPHDGWDLVWDDSMCKTVQCTSKELIGNKSYTITTSRADTDSVHNIQWLQGILLIHTQIKGFWCVNI